MIFSLPQVGLFKGIIKPAGAAAGATNRVFRPQEVPGPSKSSCEPAAPLSSPMTVATCQQPTPMPWTTPAETSWPCPSLGGRNLCTQTPVGESPSRTLSGE